MENHYSAEMYIAPIVVLRLRSLITDVCFTLFIFSRIQKNRSNGDMTIKDNIICDGNMNNFQSP